MFQTGARIDKAQIKCHVVFFFYSSGDGSVEMNSLDYILLHNKWMSDEMHYIYIYVYVNNANMWTTDEF